MAKILLFGQAPFGKSVLDGLLDNGHEITAVCMPAAREGGRPDPLAERAAEAGLRLVRRKSYKTDEAFREVDPEAADVGVLAFVTQIIPLGILDGPRLASVCFHPSLLPAYRGGTALAWQLINGETRGGVTLFRPDDGIDAGPIYLQRELEIGPDESAGSYYYAGVFDVGVAATVEAVEMVLAGTAEPAVQDESKATHDPLCRDEHAGIDWNRPVATLHNLVRGCDPSPGAHARHGDETVRFYGSRRAATDTGAQPGTVVGLSEEGIEIAAADGTLRFAKMAAAGKKAPAHEAAATIGLREGDRLEGA